MQTEPAHPEMTNLKSDEFAFIVRIWKDSADSDGSVSGWHGSIDHVGSNQRLYFYQLESILQFVRERTGIGFKPVKSWWKKLRDRLSFHFLVMR